MARVETGRTPDHPVDPQYPNRWSPRAFTGEAMPQADLLTVLEAARWAPSSYNLQPWRFVYARRGTPSWGRLLGLLMPFNQAWAKEAGALVIVLSKTEMLTPGSSTPVASYSHSFDAGAAWAYMALESQRIGWHAHAMVGLDIPAATETLGVPAGYRIEAAVALGRKAEKTVLPEKLQAREEPSGRLPVASLAFEGAFDAGSQAA